jgi:hypothetical protein
MLRAIVAIAVLGVWGHAHAQTPSGGIGGTVIDATGAAIRGAAVSIVSTDTRQLRTVTTTGEGRFTAAALHPGPYRITIESSGFKRIEREATVEAGGTTILDVTLELGKLADTVAVGAPRLSIRRDHHQIGGLVTRDRIDGLPLNGRNVLEQAKLEPGVIPTRLADGRIFVSVLGAGLQTIPRIGATRVTVDGVNITTPGTAGVLLEVSPDVVQEFQIATVNFDTATSLTSNGAINIVTRSGTNTYLGSGFEFFRDDRLAAYPSLRRDPHNPEPAFERHQFGASAGGPVRKDRMFFFASIERTDQTGVVSVQPIDELASLGGLFRSPYAGTQVNVRVDGQLSQGHTLFARHTSDRNTAFTSIGAGSIPSSWSQRVNDTRQTLVGMTNVMSSHVVHEVRASRFPLSNSSTSVAAQQCAGCFGLGEIRTVVAGGDLVFGGQGASIAAAGSRFQLTDAVTWQIGSHTLRSGLDWEHTEARNYNFGNQRGEITLFTPREAREYGLALPAAFTTPADILRLPLKQFAITVGSGTALWEGFRPERIIDLYRVHLADTWRTTDRVTLNVGLGWSYEPNAISQDLTKPALLAPLVGTDGLAPPKPEKANLSLAAGVAWAATADGRTVLRAGAGRYFDPAGSTNTANRARERELLSPLGTGTLMETGANLGLQFRVPTTFTGDDLIADLPSIRETLLQSLNPENRDLSIRNLDLTKRGNNLVDPGYTTPSSVHLSVGVQREVAPELIVSADLAWKRFSNTFINGIDYNRWNSVAGPIIPKCVGPQRDDVRALCSNGPIFFDTTSGRARYQGLLLRAEKRFSRRGQLLASYALSSFVGSNGTGTATTENGGGRAFGFNNDNWLENDGPLPTDQRHVLNISGAIQLPFDLDLAISISAYSAPPFAPWVANMDFNGDGTMNDLLPGTTVNQFGRDLGTDDLITLVQQYNQQFAGTRTADGRLRRPYSCRRRSRSTTASSRRICG